MTSVEITFRYQGDLDPAAVPRAQEYHTNYGIRGMKIDPVKSLVTVEYDATRLKQSEVAAVLRRVGVPVLEQVRAGQVA